MVVLLVKHVVKVNLACLLVFWAPSFGFSQADENETELTDSLFLLRNILKDIGKETKLDEQYTLFVRAELIYNRIKDLLSVNESKDFKKELAITFRFLPSPKEISTEEGFHFTLKHGQHAPFYWSDPVTEEMFIDYLNAIKFPVNDMSSRFFPNSHTIIHDKVLSKYKSQNPNRPLRGINYIFVKDFAEWFSQKTKHRVRLPTEDMVMASGQLNPSCWTSTVWKEKDSFRRDAWEMFGGEFYTFFVNGSRSGELPEACYPEIQVHLVMSSTTGKRLYLKALRSEI